MEDLQAQLGQRSPAHSQQSPSEDGKAETSSALISPPIIDPYELPPAAQTSTTHAPQPQRTFSESLPLPYPTPSQASFSSPTSAYSTYNAFSPTYTSHLPPTAPQPHQHTYQHSLSYPSVVPYSYYPRPPATPQLALYTTPSGRDSPMTRATPYFPLPSLPVALAPPLPGEGGAGPRGGWSAMARDGWTTGESVERLEQAAEQIELQAQAQAQGGFGRGG